jgi:hypothetical protein
MDAQTILVVILSLALAVFLVLAVVLTILLIKVTKSLRNVAQEAEDIVHNVNSISDIIRQNIKPAVISASIINGLQKVLKNYKKKERNK